MRRWRPALCALGFGVAFPQTAAALFMLTLEVGYPAASERALNWFLPPD